jgi:hypothetical protein
MRGRKCRSRLKKKRYEKDMKQETRKTSPNGGRKRW